MLAGVLLLAVVAFLVAACVIAPARHVRLIAFLVLNLFYSAKTYLSILTNRPWSGLPELRAEEWPRLHELVRETAAAVGAPRIHRVFLDPGAFNASVSVAFPLVSHLAKLKGDLFRLFLNRDQVRKRTARLIDEGCMRTNTTV